MTDERFYNFVRDFFGVQKSQMSPQIPPEPEAPKPDHVPEILAGKIKACLAHVRAVRWGEGRADCNIEDGDVQLEVRMSVKSIGKVEKKPAAGSA
jgi:hypothetical protein